MPIFNHLNRSGHAHTKWSANLMRFGLVPPRHKMTGCLLQGSLFTEILCILLDEGNAAGKNWVNKSTGNGSKMHERLWSMDSKCPFVGSHICTVGFLRGYLHDLACWLIWPETSNFELHQTEEAEFDTTACKQAWALLLLCSTKTSDILYSASLAFSFFSSYSLMCLHHLSLWHILSATL